MGKIQEKLRKIPGIPFFAHLQGLGEPPELGQALPDFPVGHSTAQGVLGRLQDPQLLPVLLQGLPKTAWKTRKTGNEENVRIKGEVGRAEYRNEDGKTGKEKKWK